MLTMVKNLNPIILDVVIVSIFILIMFFGFIRGIKKTSIDMGIFLVALFLGFCPYTNSVKEVFATSFFNVKEWLPAGSSNTANFIASLSSTLLSTIAFFLLMYIVLTVVKIVVLMIVKKKSGGGEEDGQKSMLGRVGAAFLALLYQGVPVCLLLVALSTNIMGMNKPVEKTFVAKHIVGVPEKINEDLTDTILVKMAAGDILLEVDDELLISSQNLEKEAEKLLAKNEYIELLDNEKLTTEEARTFIKERIVNLRALAEVEMAVDVHGVAKEDFQKTAEEWISSMNRVYKVRSLEKIEFTLEEVGAIRKSFEKAGVEEDVIKLYDEIVVAK